MNLRSTWIALLGLVALAPAACGDDGPTDAEPVPKDPDTAPVALVDRFSAEAGTLLVRDITNGLPEAGDPINFDEPPFITRGLGPDGDSIRYYNFDVMPLTPAPFYVLFREGEEERVEDQLSIANSLPGDPYYSDFWRVVRVTVPADYVANTITSFQEIVDADYATEPTDFILNCPFVPPGSTATLRGSAEEDAEMKRGWVDGEVVSYFTFREAPLAMNGDNVPISDIYVTFNDTAVGPASGSKVETGTDQTHNVAATLPTDDAYSPLWEVYVYDNAEFDAVIDLTSAMAATEIDEADGLVNCPIVDF